MADFGNLCMNCMSDKKGQPVCPHCGSDGSMPQMAHALPLGTLLQNRYIVGAARRENGEGITYIGYDTALKAPIELREFFPQTFCERAEDAVSVRVLGGSEVVFDECLSAFLRYSREVAHMRELSAIVSIYDIFEENHTAYTVSEWDESITLQYFVERSGGNLEWNAARQLFMPVLSALSVLHSNGVCHLGISPDTLFISQDGKMKLGSFYTNTVRQMDTDIPPDLVEGCAAIEQYVMNYKPDEATDVYGFAASLFFALTGSLPPSALKRRSDPRLMIPTAVLHSLPPCVVTALADALQVSPDKRTPTFERLRGELSAVPAVAAALEESQRIPRVQTGAAKKKKQVPGFVWVLLSCVIMLAVFAGGGFLWMWKSGTNFLNFPAEASSLASTSSDSAVMESKEVSSEADLIDAPNLVGQNYQALIAQESSQASNNPDYQVLLSSKQFSDTVPTDCIISQTPPAGGKMARGTAIVVVVSQGAAVRVLPSIAGKTLSDASEAVTSAGFVPTKETDYSDTVPADRVIGYKSVKVGSQMAYGSKVVIVVSLGPDPSKISSSASSGASSSGSSSKSGSSGSQTASAVSR